MRSIILERLENIKLEILGFLFVASISFFSGMLFADYLNEPKIEISHIPNFCLETPYKGEVYTSAGSRYFYAPWCSSSIKHKIWLSKEKALKLGLKPAKNCIGIQD